MRANPYGDALARREAEAAASGKPVEPEPPPRRYGAIDPTLFFDWYKSLGANTSDRPGTVTSEGVQAMFGVRFMLGPYFPESNTGSWFGVYAQPALGFAASRSDWQYDQTRQRNGTQGIGLGATAGVALATTMSLGEDSGLGGPTRGGPQLGVGAQYVF